MATFLCPNDGPFEAEGETRMTQPSEVIGNRARVEDAPADASTDGPELSPTHRDHDDALRGFASTLPPGTVRDSVVALIGTVELVPSVAVATGAPVEKVVGVCPECGSPIVEAEPEPAEQ